MIAVLVAVGCFAAMELVSYLTHRFLMHGPGRALHADHHRPSTGGFQHNDLYPLSFSTLAIAAFALASFGPRLHLLMAAGIGMSAYGMAYLFVHEIYIHDRVGWRPSRLPYLAWLERRHREHHRSGGEPYGMLLPLTSRSLHNDPAHDRFKVQRTGGGVSGPSGGRGRGSSAVARSAGRSRTGR